VIEDVCILISFVDELFMSKHLKPDTIGGYLTGMKNAVLAQGIESEALGRRGYRHPLVAAALRSANLDIDTVPATPPRELFTREMMKYAQRVWPVVYYAMAVLARGFIMRSGELLVKGVKRSKHLVYWNNVVLYDRYHREIPVERWLGEEAASAKVVPKSRKHQYRVVRPLSEVARVYYSPSGSLLDGLIDPNANGCLVAALQGLFVISGAAARDLSETPLCYHKNGPMMNQKVMLEWVHATGRAFGRPEGVLVTHSLKHAGITAMIEAGISDEEVRMAAGFKSIATVQTYDHPGRKAGPRLARALLLDASDSSDSDAEYAQEDVHVVDDAMMEHEAYRR
jgi:hypothetical protein